nr:MAG TPA_asm: hypothetical protein [Caudoviricetes sp.]
MKAVLTLDNGRKIAVDILPPQIGKIRRPRFQDEYERWFVEEFNKAQPRAVHKVVKAHILRN